jgi:ADP-heptose:LPS heptosyltransferase
MDRQRGVAPAVVPKMLSRRNVLIFHLGALGDFVLTWPLALALGRIYPQSRIFYVTHAQKGALAERVLRLDAADIEGGWHHLFTPNVTSESLPERARKLLASTHAVFSFLANADDGWSQNVRRLAPEAELTVLRGPRELELPAEQALLEELKSRPFVQTAVAQILNSISQRGVGFHRAPNGSVVLHPGAGSAAKRWPVERFIELAARLRADGRPVRFVIGETECGQWTAQSIAILRQAGEVKQPADYLQLLEALSSASLFIGNDSGPGHLAGIIGVPTLSLFGPTDPANWKPLGPRVQTLRQQPLEMLAVEPVYAWIQSALGSGAAPR